MVKVFVDGLDGTTGLLIHERLSRYDQLEILKIDPAKKKDLEEKKKFLNEADVVFLCLPDQAARESVALIDNPTTKVIDASTAHRIDPSWAYGIPELSEEHREKIVHSTRIANPGCHATAVALAVYPLVKKGIISPDYPLNIHTLTGYSGGGKSLIRNYEEVTEGNLYHRGPRHYGLHLQHKHIPEMMVQCGLITTPIFMPIVDNYYKGLVASIPINPSLMTQKLSPLEVQQFYVDYYKNSYFVRTFGYQDQDMLFDNAFDVTGSNDTNFADLFVYGDDETGNMVVMCRIDNLGKGASGAAVENMNLLLGLDEWTNLI